MERTIIEKLTRENFSQTTHEHLEKSSKLALRYWSGSDSLRLLDTSLAMTRGNVCPGFQISRNYIDSKDRSYPVTNFLIAFDYDLAAAFKYCLDLAPDNYPGKTVELRGLSYQITNTPQRSHRTFSPLNLANLKPLATEPEKWTMAHAYRALANNQAAELKCDGRYSDDYAFDAAVNCFVGVKLNALRFLEDIYTSPSGWSAWKSSSDQRINVTCHSFDTNSFRFG
jgi:hypothetical protein